MRVSISVTDYTWPDGARGMPEHLRDVVSAADRVGIDTVWVADHLLQMDPTVPDDPDMLEAGTVLGYLAACSERVRLGTMVAPASLRPPALLIRAVTTLDVLSAGRAWLGVGAGYQEDEARALALPLPPVKQRFEQLEDLLRLAHHMWSGDDAPFVGTHHRLEAPACLPRPVSEPHPPILVGGTGEGRTLPLVVKYADACNFFDIPDGGTTLQHKLAVLSRLCEEAGRPRREIETTVSTRRTPRESWDEFLDHCIELEGHGVDHVVLLQSGAWTGQEVEELEPVVADLAEVPTRAAGKG